MSWSIIIQILSGIALLAGLVVVIVLFYKTLRTIREKVSKQFLLIESILLIAIGCGLILLWGWPKNIISFIIISVLITCLANLPMTILVKLFMLMFSRRKPSIFPTVWDVLHDGSITAVSGTVPGTVCLDISIDYLRERFPEPGKIIQLTLNGCTRFAYRDFNEEKFTMDLSSIAAMEPMILKVKMHGNLSEIVCFDGTIEIAATGGSLSLNSGRPLPLEELLGVADAYWTEWSKNSG